MADSLASLYLTDMRRIFRQYKTMADRALAQVNDDEFFARTDPECNNLAILVKHMAGNLRSRWTDFLTADGEKPDRNRDSEFELYAEDSRSALMQRWEEGWQILFAEMDALTEGDLTATITIRQELHGVAQAINRQIAHYSYHVGQIVFLAKQWKRGDWQTLSIPRGESAQFNQRMQKGH